MVLSTRCPRVGPGVKSSSPFESIILERSDTQGSRFLVAMATVTWTGFLAKLVLKRERRTAILVTLCSTTAINSTSCCCCGNACRNPELYCSARSQTAAKGARIFSLYKKCLRSLTDFPTASSVAEESPLGRRLRSSCFLRRGSALCLVRRDKIGGLLSHRRRAQR